MKFTYQWLLQHLETDISPEQIGDALTNLGLELESFSDYSSYSNFVVATIVDFKKHPNADRLNICQVDNGGKKQFQVICGAPNVKKGLKGIFATDGMYIPGSDITLKKGKIRGEISEGMMLSERELNLSDDHEGIIEISKDYSNGTDAVTALGLNDPIFEIGITPNRGDCLGVRGIARDLAAKDIGKLKPLNFKKIDELQFESPIKWSIAEDDNNCDYVVSRFFKDVSNLKSPEWLQQRLISIGLRPINALVDITNYITIDLGRPLHVFDADKIGNSLTMNLASDKDKILALDNKEYHLDASTTVIADQNKPLAIAGVIGGLESGCTETTKNVFLEVALFDPSKVAKTGRRLGINSDARYRFERGLDKAMVEEGLEYATFLINQICGGTVSKNISAGNIKIDKIEIPYDFSFFKKIIGIDLSKEDQANILNKLFFKVEDMNDKNCVVVVPSWRNDIRQPIDLIEEIIRVFGYDNIKVTTPNATSEELIIVKSSLNNKKNKVIKKLKKSLIANNYNEIITFSFHSSDAHRFLEGDRSLMLTNGISEEHAFMRNSMLYNHLEALESNRKKGNKNLNIFEVGPIYHTSNFQENILFGISSRLDLLNKKTPLPEYSFYSLTTEVSTFLKTLNFDIKQFNISRSQSNHYHPGQSAELHMGKKMIARYGKVHPLILENFPKLSNTYCFEIYFENLPIDTMARKSNIKIQESDFQYSEKDFSFIFAKDQNLYEVYRFLTGIDKKLIRQVEFFDEYLSPDIGDDNKSITFKITIQSIDKTLDEKDLEQIHQNIINKTSDKFQAKLRS
ncbi:phenylalanine--tRNA ligase subunit beta [Alphaproteobacteria bacterium]|nr:phenylalanine--tRNA ligase subunit beta [Alphaproteobacteria bacterium]